MKSINHPKLNIALIFSLLTILFTACSNDWMDYSPIDMWSAEIDYDDNNAPKHLSVAAVSIQPSKTNKTETLNTMLSMVQKIKTEHDDIQVIVFGELILEWYFDADAKGSYQRLMAEKVTGISGDSPSVDFIQTLADSNNVNIVFGLTEIDYDSNIYNTQVLIRPGSPLVKYRKRNLNETDKDNGMTPGDDLVITEISGVRAAMFICSDMQSNKITKQIADAKVDLILHSLTSSTDLNADISYVGLQMNTWIVFSNRYGDEGDYTYTGFTHIINPAGTICERSVGKNVYAYRKIGIY